MNSSIPYRDHFDRTSRDRRNSRSSILPASEPPEIALAKELGRLIGKHMADKVTSPKNDDPQQIYRQR